MNLLIADQLIDHVTMMEFHTHKIPHTGILSIICCPLLGCNDVVSLYTLTKTSWGCCMLPEVSSKGSNQQFGGNPWVPQSHQFSPKEPLTSIKH
jgi:hypothetical protein